MQPLFQGNVVIYDGPLVQGERRDEPTSIRAATERAAYL